MSCRAVCEHLGIELREVPDWSCCGASPAHSRGKDLQAALAARNLELARSTGAEQMTTPCPSCLAALKTAGEYAEDAEKNELLGRLCGSPIQGAFPSRSLLQVIYEDYGVDALKDMITAPLKGMKMAPYYGCLLTRPPELMQFDDRENPVSMDELMQAAGATVVDFPFKVDCCGASFGVPRLDMVSRLSGRIVDMAVRCKADVIVVACPLCHQNLDMRQPQLTIHGATKPLPVIYFTQALGLAMGIAPHVLGLDKHFVSTDALLHGMAGAAARSEAALSEERS